MKTLNPYHFLVKIGCMSNFILQGILESDNVIVLAIIAVDGGFHNPNFCRLAKLTLSLTSYKFPENLHLS